MAVRHVEMAFAVRAAAVCRGSVPVCTLENPLPLDDPALFTNTSEWQQFIADDPLALHAVSSSLLNAGRDLDHIVSQQSPELRLPVLLMLAGNDQLIDNQATLSLVSKLRSSQLTIRHWAGATHTLEFEPNREQIFTELIDWLAAGS